MTSLNTEPELAEDTKQEVPTLLYSHASRLLTQIESGTDTVQDQDCAESGDESNDALDALAEVGLRLAQHPALGLQDVARKIDVWRALVQEDLLCPDTAPVDGKLLLSILNDVTTLAGRKCSSDMD